MPVVLGRAYASFAKASRRRRIEIDQTFEGLDGAKIAADVFGEGPPVLLLHGGGQTRGSWRRVARTLADEGYQAITLDARGHGESDWAADGYSIQLLAGDLRAVMKAVGGVPVVIGASLGGITALYALGSEDPPPAAALVLVDIALKTREEGRGAITQFMAANPDGFASVEEAADAVSRYMTHRPRPANVEGLKRNLRLRNGRYYWHWDPAFMLPKGVDETGRQWRPVDLAEAARRISVPTLLVRGALSELVDQDSIDHLRGLIPHLEVAEVPGAGHMVAGDANSPFADEIFEFLRRVRPSR